MSKERLSFSQRCELLSTAATEWSGSTNALLVALALPVLWLLSGTVVRLLDSWNFVFGPLTAFVPLVILFLIQRSQNKEYLAVQLKLNEVVAAIEGASNRLIDVEDLTEEDLKVLREHYQGLAEMAKQEMKIGESHSVEEARQRHSVKQTSRGTRR